MRTVYILHVPSGETYPVDVTYHSYWFNKEKPNVIDAIQLAQAEEDNAVTVSWGDILIHFTKKFDAFLFKCQPPTEIINYTLNMPIVVLSDEFELIDSINIEKMGVL